MQNTLKITVLTVFLLFPYFDLKAQTPSTEGTEFWVTLTIGDNNENKSGFNPYLAISAKTACTVTITNPNTAWTISRQVAANSWTEITDIPLLQWYPSASTDNTQDANYSEVVYQTGLQVTSTANISLYSAHRMNYSFDASNILPTKALMSEYIIQDYPPSEQRSVFAIVATENNTTVNITPSAETVKGHTANTAFSVTLQKGEVYEVLSKNEGWDGKNASESGNAVTFSGTYIQSTRPVAVFNGCVRTRIPSDKAARDLLYEQAMPTAYWGTQFVVTKSLNRNADRVRITALNDATEVKINGTIAVILQSQETFEFEMSDGTIHAASGSKTVAPALTVGGDACFVETSCPCAVYLYTVGVDYDKAPLGDPAMVWISPIEQRVKEITFGVMGTDLTTAHYVNIITETSNVSSMQLLNAANINSLSASDFQTLSYNPTYSYARKQVATTSGQKNPAFTLKGDGGFVAHVYGHGDQESYAYSVGSATVQKSIKIDGDNLVSGKMYTQSLCVGDTLHIETNFGNYSVDRVSWDMGDGVTIDNGDSSFYYVYDGPGIYDLIAITQTTNPCTNVTFYDTISVSFKVSTPKLITRTEYICEGENYTMGDSVFTTTGVHIYEYNCDSIVTLDLTVVEKTSSTVELTAYDSLLWNGTMYYESGSYEYHTLNSGGCDSTVTLNLQILTCLELQVDSVLENIICGDDDMFTIPYVKIKGDIAEATLQLGTATQDLTFSNTEFIALLDGVTPNVYNAVLTVSDIVCNRDLTFPVKLTVRYPNSIFAQKWDDVFAVYNKNYNGGYTFTAFQWYKNGSIIAGATGSYLYLGDESFNVDDEYAVELTRNDGVVLMSCPKNPVIKTNAQAVTINPSYVGIGEVIYVNTGLSGTATFYDVMGIRQTQVDFPEGTNAVTAPAKAGFYLMDVQLQDGRHLTFHIVVKK